MSARTSTPVIVFSCVGHLYIHICTAFYFVIVLALEGDWNLPYHELLELWTLGALMVGAAALPAGMLSDRLGAPFMMMVFFIGMGACSIGAGFADSTFSLMLWLTGIGVFAAIYHPVGIPWLVRNTSKSRGKILGFNGIFGSVGAATASLTAGALIDLINWRAAFIVPGIVSVVTGLIMWLYFTRGELADNLQVADHPHPAERRDTMRVYGILLITMFLAGMIFHTTQTALPKVFELRHQGLIGEGAFGVGLLVAIVYGAAGVMQLVGGHLADRYPLKSVYTGSLMVQVPLLWLAANVGGVPLLVVATLMVMANIGQLPAENMMLARYTPAKHHGVAFGIKFVLAFGVGPLAVLFVATINRTTGEFFWVFATLTAFAACAAFAALLLPRERAALPTPA